MKRDLFSNVTFKPARFCTDIQKNPAQLDYVIFFTPRSGSSWLTDILWKTGVLGRPGEWFNPNFVPKTAQSINADNLDNYIELLKRKQSPGAVFGFEITYYQMRATFGGEKPFLSYFPPQTPSFFLIRENIVLQAVSLAKSVASRVSHSVNASSEEISKADSEFEYDTNVIRRWLRHIFDQETRFEAMFERRGIRPLRLSYERMMAASPAATINLFRQHLGVTELGEPVEQGRHTKIGTDKNLEFATRFAEEEADLLRKIATCRAKTLARLSDLSLPVTVFS